MFRKYRQSVPPAFLSPSEVERVLAATGSTLSGRRDHAILLLLARLGLRGGEVVALELDDIRWRAGEIVVHGKGRMVDHLPLLSDVGEALALYIREGRGVSASRRVFLRIWAPRNGLAGPAAVGHIVRRALAQAGVRRSGRGAAHLFRHGLATKMIRHGASISEIAEVLRHRSQNTTAIYAQVSFEALREVALPWPVTGGARRPLGTQLQEPAMTLAQFLEFLEREGAEFITSALALRWAMEPKLAQPATWARRLGMVRRFASWLSTIGPRTEVPPPRLLAARRRRNKPHIFTQQEIARLMDEAAKLNSSSGLRAMTYKTLIGLLSAIGLRPGAKQPSGCNT